MEHNTMWKSLVTSLVLMLMLAAAPAHAGTHLQLQFKQWAYLGNGLAKVLVVLRNPTMKPFATVVWQCDLYDKENRLVSRTGFVFHVVAWGALTVDSQVVATNGQFQNGECQLVRTEDVTYENERLYRGSPSAIQIGLGIPGAGDQYFDFDRYIQGRAKVISDEEETRLERLNEAGQLTGPGYRKR
jgi:hypothetical protein